MKSSSSNTHPTTSSSVGGFGIPTPPHIPSSIVLITIPTPPRRRGMEDDTKLHVFKGTSLEDPEKHWFLCEAVWTIKQINDDNVKLV